MKFLSRLSSYLPDLDANQYEDLPRGYPGVINYLLDSYFNKLTAFSTPKEVGESPPLDPSSDIKERWLGCEIHKCYSLNKTYPAFARSLNAHAFAMLFSPYGGEMASYVVVPYLDSYAWKSLLKMQYGWQIQQEVISVSADEEITLPVFGTFFVKNSSSGVPLIVSIDLCFDRVGCNFSVLSNPRDKKYADKFLKDLDASRSANDIYYKKCMQFVDGGLDFHKVKKTNWDDIIIKPEIKESIVLNTVDILNNVDKLNEVGLVPNRNLLLISPPGMAKTTIFRAICNESLGKHSVIWCTGKSIDIPERVTSLFDAARSLSPCLIIIEDMDLFGKDRSMSQGGNSNHILNEFLACLDGTSDNNGVIVLASTNDVASMDEALVNRPGRFDMKIEMPLPDPADRFKMIGSFCNGYKAKCAGPDIKNVLMNVVNMTEGLTGAYIKDLVKTAVLKAISCDQRDESGRVIISPEDLVFATNQIMKNFEIGKRAKKHI